jgi:plasmid stabilization system protein ParE
LSGVQVPRWTKAALQDLEEAISLAISRGSGQSRRLGQDVETAIEHLHQWPAAGRAGQLAETREYLLPDLPYRIPYKFDQGTLIILRFLHTSRRWPNAKQSSRSSR